MNNRERLMDLIVQYELDRRDVARMVRVGRETIDHWLLTTESKNHEDIPDMAIELLELKLGTKPLKPHGKE